MGSSVNCSVKKCQTPYVPTHRFEQPFGDELVVGYLCENHTKVAEKLGWNLIVKGVRTS